MTYGNQLEFRSPTHTAFRFRIWHVRYPFRYASMHEKNHSNQPEQEEREKTTTTTKKGKINYDVISLESPHFPYDSQMSISIYSVNYSPAPAFLSFSLEKEANEREAEREAESVKKRIILLSNAWQIQINFFHACHIRIIVHLMDSHHV